MMNVSRVAFDANDRGERLFAEGKLDEALAAFNEAVLASPGYAAGWLNRAHVLERLGRSSEAEADREAARSLISTMQSRALQQAQVEPAREWATLPRPRPRYDSDIEDVAGPGRYILNFLLAGFVGLLMTFFLRNHGWLATWISLAIFVAMLVMLVAQGPEALGLNFDSSSR